MQGNKSTIGSLPETLGFNHGSTSADSGIEQQVCWSNMTNSAQNPLSGYILSPNDTSIAYLNSTNQEVQNLSGWHLGEASSGAMQDQANYSERKTESGWHSSLNVCAGVGPTLEERQYGPANVLSANSINMSLANNAIANVPLSLHPSSSDSITRDVNINSDFMRHSFDDPVMGSNHAYKSAGPENVRTPSNTDPAGPSGVPPGSNGYLVEENDGRPGWSLERRRFSGKRKAFEGNSGQSSGSGTSNYFHPAEGSTWQGLSPDCNAGSSSISAPSGSSCSGNSMEQVNVRRELGIAGAASEDPFHLCALESAESLQRNFRLRIDGSHPQDSSPGNSPSAARHFSVPSLRLHPVNNSLDLRPAPGGTNTNLQGQSVVCVPSVRRNLHSSRWSGSSSSRPGSSSSCHISGERDSALHEGFGSRSIPRNISESPMFVPAREVRNSTQNPTNWSLTGGNLSMAGNVTSTSRAGPGSVALVPTSSGPSGVPPRNPPRYPRRLSEFVRHSLLSSADTGLGGISSNYPPQLSGPSASSQEFPLPSGAVNQGPRLSRSRSTTLLERQPDGAFGIPYSLRTLGAASEGRSRLVSEIRNVLDLMRRGEGLRFEDVMILDQSIFFGMADVHDRHRDMRLDVDNMSYEELLALEERIGNVSTGLSEETIKKCLKQRKYISITSGDKDTEPCCICQEEYNNGEDVGTLQCGHDFHGCCIKQWLMHKNLCPICKTTGLNTATTGSGTSIF